MKLLLDENLPHQMRLELTGHEVFTVAFMGWSGVANGELLSLAATAGIEALITTDRGMEYQQNVGLLPIAVIVIVAKSNTLEAIRPGFPRLLLALNGISRGQFAKISIP